jgi:hypothetical protein
LVATGDGEDAGAQNVGHCAGDLRRIAMVGDDRRQRLDEAKPLAGTGERENAAPICESLLCGE